MIIRSICDVESRAKSERGKVQPIYKPTHIFVAPTFSYANRNASDTKRHVERQKGQFFISRPLEGGSNNRVFRRLTPAATGRQRKIIKNHCALLRSGVMDDDCRGVSVGRIRGECCKCFLAPPTPPHPTPSPPPPPPGLAVKLAESELPVVRSGAAAM